MTARMNQRGALPNLIIIGGMKCGTTSLHYYLGLHPQIAMSAQKELNFFAKRGNWHKGAGWYRSWFTEEARIRGEASPRYTSYPKSRGVPERMHAVVPEAKLIYLVRDPVERLLSHYVHNVSENFEDRPLREALHDPSRGYLDRSRYFMQIEQYLPFYPETRLLIVGQEDLRHDQQKTLRRIFDFLGVDSSFHDVRLNRKLHRSRRKRRKTKAGQRLAKTWPMRLLARLPGRLRWLIEAPIYWPLSRPVERPEPAAPLRREIEHCLQDDVRQLRAFTGETFEAWPV